MKFFRYVFSIIFIVAVCVACGLDTSSSDTSNDFTVSYIPKDCSDASQKEFIYKYMHDAYLWRDEVPELDYTAYSTNDDLMEALKAPEDRYSAIYTQEYLDNYYEGNNVGLGFSLAYTTDSKIYLRYVIPGSPAAQAGLERGDRIISVNGYSAFDIINVDGMTDVAFGASEAGVQDVIEFIDKNGIDRTVTVTKAQYYAASVYDYDVYTDSSNGKKIGYLMYNSFSENKSDLTAAFTAFARAGVRELIIDLRYNGGGLVDTAQYLASNLGGRSLTDKILLYMTYNSSYSKYNKAYKFTASSYSIEPDKIVFLVSGETASASELVINGFRPFKNVYIIGDTTYGKNVGMTYVLFCGQYMSAINFANSNALHYGDYASGISPDCYKYEDSADMKDFGDTNEKMLSSALTYLDTGTCVSETKSALKKRLFPRNNNLGIDHFLK